MDKFLLKFKPLLIIVVFSYFLCSCISKEIIYYGYTGYQPANSQEEIDELVVSGYYMKLYLKEGVRDKAFLYMNHEQTGTYDFNKSGKLIRILVENKVMGTTKILYQYEDGLFSKVLIYLDGKLVGSGICQHSFRHEMYKIV